MNPLINDCSELVDWLHSLHRIASERLACRANQTGVIVKESIVRDFYVSSLQGKYVADGIHYGIRTRPIGFGAVWVSSDAPMLNTVPDC